MLVYSTLQATNVKWDVFPVSTCAQRKHQFQQVRSLYDSYDAGEESQSSRRDVAWLWKGIFRHWIA